MSHRPGHSWWHYQTSSPGIFFGLIFWFRCFFRHLSQQFVFQYIVFVNAARNRGHCLVNFAKFQTSEIVSKTDSFENRTTPFHETHGKGGSERFRFIQMNTTLETKVFSQAALHVRRFPKIGKGRWGNIKHAWPYSTYLPLLFCVTTSGLVIMRDRSYRPLGTLSSVTSLRGRVKGFCRVTCFQTSGAFNFTSTGFTDIPSIIHSGKRLSISTWNGNMNQNT